MFSEGRPAPVNVPDVLNCAECGMRVKGKDLRFASEMILRDGKVKYFCDLGDLLVAYAVSKKKDQIAAIYIKDYNTGSWAEGRESAYLTESKVVTPMRYGIIAFRDRSTAERVKKENGGGAVYTFEQVLASKAFRR